jgi:hypothetical protein
MPNNFEPINPEKVVIDNEIDPAMVVIDNDRTGYRMIEADRKRVRERLQVIRSGLSVIRMSEVMFQARLKTSMIGTNTESFGSGCLFYGFREKRQFHIQSFKP